MQRSRVLLVAIVFAAVAVLLVPAAPASAGVLDATCLGTLTNTYDPGLTLTPQTHTVTNETSYTPCVSLSHPAVVSGTSEVTVQAVTSCLIVLQPGSGSKTILWNTGQQSVFAWDRTVTSAGALTIVTLTGEITAGLFKGADAIEVETFPTINVVDCLAPGGLKSRSAAVTLEIVSL